MCVGVARPIPRPRPPTREVFGLFSRAYPIVKESMFLDENISWMTSFPITFNRLDERMTNYMYIVYTL